ncbi:MAG TPA: 4-hydroxyphenylpyruvate dioxygenase, partial [Allosphingosinicella sp.]
GGSCLYLVDAAAAETLYREGFEPLPGADKAKNGAGLHTLDHLTHNVHRGRMDHWAQFYERIFNFRQIRYFDIEGQQTALLSRAMTAPDDKIRIPLNESQDEFSQIEEFLKEYKGEGIQHLALATDDIFATVDQLRANGIRFQDSPDTYYDMIDKRVPGHGHSIAEMRKRRILIDGSPETGEGLLLQIFTENMIGPIFFEIIQRKGNEGFGEGNFKALFESIELDQIRRGVIPAASEHA